MFWDHLIQGFSAFDDAKKVNFFLHINCILHPFKICPLFSGTDYLLTLPLTVTARVSALLMDRAFGNLRTI